MRRRSLRCAPGGAPERGVMARAVLTGTTVAAGDIRSMSDTAAAVEWVTRAGAAGWSSQAPHPSSGPTAGVRPPVAW